MSRVLELTCHPQTPANAIRRVRVELGQSFDGLLLSYFVEGKEALSLAAGAPSERTANLWQTTCFEMFLRPAGARGYHEYNFSPSTQWAAYAFDGYREGMTDLPCPVPPSVERGEETGEPYVVRIHVDLNDIAKGPLRIGLSAVIEEKDGTKSYWALAHPPGKPDFHHPACFALELPAPSAS
ncbi:hypothetical protein GCM10007897_09130 [Sphingobium jiangsuense]|uniref:DOMON-like domain-containing protein n=1 Tax=Sphingobium jiangsuense TaxID=870476 RepID=A0A7W6BP55_9SPHN|nr:DOMON-like domain-containing protein [Sphingobium jiangsuense]MBB3927187.1 hypothetical protein [Sphingobium jiangsuense]GLS99533.1 hypothetical protein GCM10007897_09130 [Sphingobium jiangsuense]